MSISRCSRGGEGQHLSNAAILAGDTETGVSLMELEEGLDTGPVFARSAIPIGEDETADELRHQLGEIGTGLLLHALSEGLGRPVPQTGEPTYAAKVEPAELHLDFSLPADIVNRTVRLGQGLDHLQGEAPAGAQGEGAP